MERLNPDTYRNAEVQGIFSRFVLRSVPMPLEVAQEIWVGGGGVPLDVVPSEFWWPPGEQFPRFSEEELGEGF